MQANGSTCEQESRQPEVHVVLGGVPQVRCPRMSEVRRRGRRVQSNGHEEARALQGRASCIARPIPNFRYYALAVGLGKLQV